MFKFRAICGIISSNKAYKALFPKILYKLKKKTARYLRNNANLSRFKVCYIYMYMYMQNGDFYLSIRYLFPMLFYFSNQTLTNH